MFYHYSHALRDHEYTRLLQDKHIEPYVLFKQVGRVNNSLFQISFGPSHVNNSPILNIQIGPGRVDISPFLNVIWAGPNPLEAQKSDRR